ncbi:histidine ammonia-lyase [Polaromonas sp. JS666]|uniref:histidine ammonia-lyase n=1 Tax=Polaromonas sp. (strain JS666 / ATCC BAA-500) TaxID=296591 RepID=UPI0000464074|nr:histidine ammonia-lyase [Polaromonas sp. JS666]ABE43111.1 histidine ammonia-lyase [Polaromonas sp. JS666]
MNIQPGFLTLTQLRQIHAGSEPLTIDPSATAGIRASAQLVQQAAQGGAAVYGVNTGFGKLANQRIAQTDLNTLQLNLLRSHAVGVGEPMPERVVRLVLLLKAASLARGFSGVRECVIDLLLALYNHGLTPVIPCQGSVGASGDLAPLAHLCLPLIGEGEVFYRGERLPAAAALQQAPLAPIQLSAKEGLALINGTQVSTALALDALLATERLFEAAVISGAVTLDAARGSDGPFDPRIHAVRGQPGQIACAAAYRALMVGSEIRRSHLEGDDRVQDPYCLRCQPQVMGACLDQMRYASQVLMREANAVTDNPLVFASTQEVAVQAGAVEPALPGHRSRPLEGEVATGHVGGELLSGGNFHAEPVALAADALAVVIAEIGAITERRIAMLVDTVVSRLPAFLTPEPGLNSGFMIVHVTAAALASENKSLAHPASVDSLPTSANQEDHVSMATFAARRLQPMLRNTEYIVAIELLTAAQGIEFLRPLKSASVLEGVLQLVRSVSPAMMRDRSLAPDIGAVHQLVAQGRIGLAGEAQITELTALRLV